MSVSVKPCALTEFALKTRLQYVILNGGMTEGTRLQQQVDKKTNP